MSAILTLSISREAPGCYLARVTNEGLDIAEPSHHTSVNSAIFDRCDPPALRGVKGYHVWYSGVYVGTIAIKEMEARESGFGGFLPALSEALA